MLVDMECEHLCSSQYPSQFRSSSVNSLKNFSFPVLAAELETKAPVLFSILKHVAIPTGGYSRKRVEGQQLDASLVIAASTLLKKRCMHLNAVAYIIGLMLWQGNASTKVSKICIYLTRCVSFTV